MEGYRYPLPGLSGADGEGLCDGGGTSGGAGGACGGVRPPLRLHDRLGQLYGLYPDSACSP